MRVALCFYANARGLYSTKVLRYCYCMAHDNTAHVVTYMTPEEQKQLRLRAAEAGMSLSAYVRDVLRGDLHGAQTEGADE